MSSRVMQSFSRSDILLFSTIMPLSKTCCQNHKLYQVQFVTSYTWSTTCSAPISSFHLLPSNRSYLFPKPEFGSRCSVDSSRIPWVKIEAVEAIQIQCFSQKWESCTLNGESVPLSLVLINPVWLSGIYFRHVLSISGKYAKPVGFTKPALTQNRILHSPLRNL